MTQQSQSWAYTLRKPQLKKTYVFFYCSTIYNSRTWKQPRHPSTDEWVKQLWYVYTMEYYSTIKRNEIESVVVMWMKLEPPIQSEGSQKQKNKYHVLTHICGV